MSGHRILFLPFALWVGASCQVGAPRASIESAMTFYTQGEVQNDLGNYEKAVEKFEKAIELNPRLVEAWLSKGIALSTWANWRRD